MKYKNQICPVCENKFNENDDIVVCPECGTPHHRDCYLSLGNCKNESLHQSGFSYKSIEVNDTGLDILIDDEIKNNSAVEKTVEIKIDSENVNKENLQNVVRELLSSINGKTAEQIQIDGNEATFYEAAIKKNQNYYIPRFIVLEGTKKKFLINFSALFFPMAWCLYRKMYKFAIIAFCIYTALLSVAVAPILSNEEISNSIEICLEEDPEFMSKYAAYMAQEDVNLTPAQTKFITLLENFKYPKIISVISFVVTFGLRIIYGLYGTKMYKDKLTKNIKKVLLLPLEKNQILTYLSSKYGVIPMLIAAFFGFFEFLLFF